LPSNQSTSVSILERPVTLGRIVLS